MPRPHPIAVLAVITTLSSVVFAAKRDSWVEVRSHNFVVVSNAGEKQTRKAAMQFEQIRAAFRQTLEVARVYPSPVVTVIAVKDESSMRELLPEYWAKGRAHPAGMFVSRFNLFDAAVELDAHGSNPYETFYHEYYHAITNPYYPGLPLWLSEGLAEFFGHSDIDDKYVELGKADQDVVRQLWDTQFIPLDVLCKVDRSSPYYNEANKTTMFYAEAWVLTHYLMIGDRGAHKTMLMAYLNALNHGSSQDEALQAFGDLKQLQSILQGYIHQTTFSYLKYPAPAVAENELTIRPLSEAEVDAYQAGFAVLRNHLEDGKALLDHALQLDPNVSMAYQYLAVSDFAMQQRPQAMEAVTKAISLDPKNAFSRYLRSFLAVTGSGPEAADKQIEEDLRQAIASDPEFAPAYSLLAVYFATVNRNLKEALASAQKAISFEPGNPDYQLALAQVYVRMNDLKQADVATAKARAWARTREEKNSAARFTAFLQQVHDFQAQPAEDAEESVNKLRADASAELAKSTPQAAPLSAETDSPVQATTTKPPTRLPALQMQSSISILSDAMGFDFTAYLKQMMEAMRQNLTGSVRQTVVHDPRSLSAEFAVLKDGTIAGLKISSSSGDVGLDEATRGGIADCSPLPKLPRAFKGDYIRLHVGLTYSPVAEQ